MRNKELEISLTRYITLKHNQDECSGFIDGYIQCQENNKDKKYTEEDMIDAIIYGSSLTTSNVKLYAHNYIKSLNKQD
jgi:hypothetical protein